MKTRLLQRTIPLDEARAIIDAAIQPIERTERVPLQQAHGRVLAGDIVSDADVPPFARAAMDGYAVRAIDTTGATRGNPPALACIEDVFTGQMPQRHVGAGQCIAVATGAPMPDGADAVVMAEETIIEDFGDPPMVRILAAAAPGQNIGRQGADIRRGQTVLLDGTLLNASRVGSIAALGITSVEVYQRPRVAVLSTGNEIVEPGQPLAPGQIYDINRITLSAVVGDNGGIAVPHRTAADAFDELTSAVDACLGEDMLVFSGGSSVGERDLILDVISARGEVLFHGIDVKPGKPTAFGRIAGTLVFGMPGYPTSCLSNAYILLAPALRRLARLPARTTQTRTLPLGARVVSVAGRHQFYTVRIVDDPARGAIAMPAFKASGDITSMSQADGYIEIPAATLIIEPGTLVDVTLF
jgi:molybdenum cofactor synthesis domain-containing protein